MQAGVKNQEEECQVWLGVSGGADRETMLLIFQAMIRSALDYGSSSKTVLARLDVVLAKALRLCRGAFRTSPAPALLIEM